MIEITNNKLRAFEIFSYEVAELKRKLFRENVPPLMQEEGSLSLRDLPAGCEGMATWEHQLTEAEQKNPNLREFKKIKITYLRKPEDGELKVAYKGEKSFPVELAYILTLGQEDAVLGARVEFKREPPGTKPTKFALQFDRDGRLSMESSGNKEILAFLETLLERKIESWGAVPAISLIGTFRAWTIKPQLVR